MRSASDHCFLLWSPTGRLYADDADGQPVSLARMALDAATAAAEAAAAAARQRAGNDGDGQDKGGRAPRQRVGLEAPKAAHSGPARMTGLWLGCVENAGGFFPIRDPSSKW